MAAKQFKSDYVIEIHSRSYFFKGNSFGSQSGSGIGIYITSMECIGVFRILETVGSFLYFSDFFYTDKSVYVSQSAVIRSNDILIRLSSATTDLRSEPTPGSTTDTKTVPSGQ